MSTIKEFTNHLRSVLQPQGTADVVKLQLGNYGIVPGQLVRDAIDDLEKLMVCKSLDIDDKASALEKLAILLLTDSAGIEL